MNSAPKFFLLLGVLTAPVVDVAYGIERPFPVVEKSTTESLQDGVEDEAITEIGEPWLGLSGDPLPDILKAHIGVDRGVVIHFVSLGSPAEKAGIKAHDVLLKVNDRPVGSQLSLKEALLEYEVGDQVKITLLSKGKQNILSVKLARKPNDENEAKPLAERQWIEPRETPRGQGGLLSQGRGSLQGALGQIDPRHQKMIEDLLNDRGRGFDLHRQLDRQFEAMREQMDQAGATQKGLQLNFKNVMGSGASHSSVMTMGDEEGSITMKRNNAGTEVIVKNRQGEVVFEGPYHTDEDKSKVDPALRKRIESQNFSLGRGGLGLRSLFER